MTVDSSMVVDAVIQFVATEWDPIPVGDSGAPTLAGVASGETTYEEALEVGYIAVYQVPIGDSFAHRGFSGGQGMQWIRVQFSVAGRTAQQVRRIGSAVARSVVDRSEVDTSLWVNDIPVAGHEILDRKMALTLPWDPAGKGGQGGQSVDLLVQVSA